MQNKPLILADIGSNHRNSLEIAYAQIEAAKAAGCDAAKFQLFTHAELYGLPGKLEYELPVEWLPKLKECADRNGIEFMCSAFSPEGVRAVDPFVTHHKLASAEMKHVEMIAAIKDTRKPWIVSTGGATKPEVQWLIDNFDDGRMTILECVALYPSLAHVYDLNTFRHYDSFNIPYGLSDHTVSNSVALAALGLGARVFEKHFDDMDYGDATPDSPVSLNSSEMRAYCESIHEAYSALGDGEKSNRHQHDMAKRWRRRLIATKDLLAGDVLHRGLNFGIYRSLVDDTRGAPPEAIEHFDGKVLSKPVKMGHSLWLDDIR